MKKGQGAINAAVLVAIIAGLIILYILFLPGEERRAIIGENDTSSSSNVNDEEENILLFDEEIKLEFMTDKTIDHEIDPINLYTRTEGIKLKEINSLYVRKGWFDKKTREVTFNTEEPENADNILLAFNVKKSKGRLVIELNGNEVFNNEILTLDEPIKLPKEYLNEKNTLLVYTSGVGVKFWSTNEYILENLQITGDITDVSTRQSKNLFFITDEEKSSLDEATLRFSAECDPTEVGILDVLINNQNIYSSVPDCGSLTIRDFSTSYLLSGENSLIFRTGKGRYLIDQINVKTKLKESPAYVNYFTLTGEQINDIEDGNKNVNLTLEFIDDEEDKEARIIINGATLYMRRIKDIEFSKVINSYVEEGSNSLKIVPVVSIDIKKLRVELVED